MPAEPVGEPLVLFVLRGEALHRDAMGDLGEGGRGGATGPLRRRVRRQQVRVLLLQRAQLAHEGVEVGIADRRLVEIEVAVLVVADLGTEPVDAGDRVVDARRRGHHDHGSHGLTASRSGNGADPWGLLPRS